MKDSGLDRVPDIKYSTTISPDGTTVNFIASFDALAAKIIGPAVQFRLIEEIIIETAHMWLKDNYLEIAGKISVDAVVNAAIGKIVVEALRDKLKEEEK